MTKLTRALGSGGLIAWSLGSILLRQNEFFIFLVLVGLICVWVAYFRASRELSERRIKKYFVVAMVLYIIGNVFFSLIATVASIDFKKQIIGTDVLNMHPIGYTVVVIFLIVGSWFWYKASVLLTEHTAVGLYKVGGGFILTGSFLAIIQPLLFIVVGSVGNILQMIAFAIGTKKISDDISTVD